MKVVYNVGDKKQYTHKVSVGDLAEFHGNIVHEVCSTFAMGRDMEWTTRQFVLDMREPDEEGIGTFLTIQHKAPAFINEEISFVAEVSEINGHELLCNVIAKVGDRVVATGQTGQKILKKEKINSIFAGLRKGLHE